MSNYLVLSLLAGLTALFYGWSFRHLPSDRWQVLATIPRRQDAQGDWQGLNLTWYGFFTASAYVIAVATFLVLIATIPAHIGAAATLVALTLVLCVPASRWVSRIIDRKPYGFTVAGAYTLGAVVMPLLAGAINLAAAEELILLAPTLAAGAIALVIGEGIGRLACISFGCCYGIPLAECPNAVSRLFLHRGFRFIGDTKKASYESGLSGVLLVPIQAMTAVVLTVTAFAATALFLNGLYRAAFVSAVVVSQLWRFASEWLRADDRGSGRITAYQWMALGFVVYGALGALIVADRPAPTVSLYEAASKLWNPLGLLALQALWALVFLYTGCSRTTAASLRLHVCRDRV